MNMHHWVCIAVLGGHHVQSHYGSPLKSSWEILPVWANMHCVINFGRGYSD